MCGTHRHSLVSICLHFSVQFDGNNKQHVYNHSCLRGRMVILTLHILVSGYINMQDYQLQVRYGSLGWNQHIILLRILIVLLRLKTALRLKTVLHLKCCNAVFQLRVGLIFMHCVNSWILDMFTHCMWASPLTEVLCYNSNAIEYTTE